MLSMDIEPSRFNPAVMVLHTPPFLNRTSKRPMSYAEKVQMTYLVGSCLVSLLCAALLLLPGVRRWVRGRHLLLAGLATPLVQLFMFLLIVQNDAGGSPLLGELRCSGLHGGGYSGCSLVEALLEAGIASLLFSFLTIGLLPLAIFLTLLLCLITMAMRRARNTQR